MRCRLATDAMAMDPTNVVPVYTIGEVHATMGAWADAVRFLEKANELGPTDAMVSGRARWQAFSSAQARGNERNCSPGRREKRRAR